MSYGNKQIVSSESRTCAEASGNGIGGDRIAGLRGPYGYDEAYAINRIRYNVALINHNNSSGVDLVDESSERMGEVAEVIDVYPIQDAIDMINRYRKDFGIDLLAETEQLK
jgi:hypothetical protein